MDYDGAPYSFFPAILLNIYIYLSTYMSVMPGPRVRNVIKNVFDVNLHHDPIRVSVEEDSNAQLV